ncbi:MAG: hypothetical protein R3C03_00160 [Pirellulaceae bacterium]
MRTILTIAIFILLHGQFVSGQENQRRNLVELFERAMQRNDANKDQKLSKEEFTGREQLFARLDTNQDGLITREEVTTLQKSFADNQMRRNEARREAGQAPEDVEVQRDITYGTGGQRNLKMHLVLPKERSSEKVSRLRLDTRWRMARWNQRCGYRPSYSVCATRLRRCNN